MPRLAQRAACIASVAWEKEVAGMWAWMLGWVVGSKPIQTTEIHSIIREAKGQAVTKLILMPGTEQMKER